MHQSHDDSRNIIIDFSDPSPVQYPDCVSDPEDAEARMRIELDEGDPDDPVVFFVPKPAQIERASNAASLKNVLGDIARIGRMRGVRLVVANHLASSDSNRGGQEAHDG